MGFGSGNFLSTLMGGRIGQSLAPGLAGDYMRRPASNTNLPRTMGSNLLARFQARPQTTFTGMGTGGSPAGGAGGMMPGTGGGTRPASPQSYMGGGAPRPQYQTSAPQPNLRRFVPFTGANGQSMLGGGQQARGGGGLFGGLGQGGMLGGSGTGGQGGDYRTLLAQLFPAFRGQGPMNRAVDDYFLGEVQPNFFEQNPQLR